MIVRRGDILSACAGIRPLCYLPASLSTSKLSEIIGLFGLVGAAGVCASPIPGRLADKRGPYPTTAVALFIITSSFVILITLGDYVEAIVCKFCLWHGRSGIT